MNNPRILETPPDWTPEEKPALPGSPPSIEHSNVKRILYLVIGVLVAICGGLGNGIITANLPQIQGEYGLTPSQAAWLPAMYVIANISSNILLFKARQQYGLRWFSELILLAFMILIFMHIFVQTYPMALFVRAVSGFVGAPLSSLGMYYVMQGFGPRYKIQGLFMGFGISQLAVPLAWIISPYLTGANDWGRLYTFELGLSICCFAMVVALKLPRSLRIDVFEKQDLVTFFLLAPGFGLLCAVLVQGPILWWTNAPSLAYALIGGLALIMVGFIFEHYRTNPLIVTRWLGTGAMIRFIIGAIMIRFIMSEQSYAVVNFLKSMGLVTDQFVGFYTVIFIGILCGTIFSTLTFSRERLFAQVLFAVFLVILASIYDSHILTSDVRPQNFYLSQFMVAFAGGLFVAPLLIMGFGRAIPQGLNHVVTFIILFSATQNLGGLIGSTFYSTLQQQRIQFHRQQILQDMQSTDANVNQRLTQYQASYRSVITDSTLANQQAQQTLNQVVNREAQIMAYEDIITVNSYIAIGLFLWSLHNIYLAKRAAKAAANAGS